jgi:hypothetical protein
MGRKQKILKNLICIYNVNNVPGRTSKCDERRHQLKNM